MKISDLQSNAKKYENKNKKLLIKLKQKEGLKLDKLFLDEHNRVFKQINCLECANCCKLLGPRLKKTDISRMAKILNLSESIFYKKYLKTDTDGDIIFLQLPCPFLLPDNYCSIYENRPKACREYPHTNRKKIHQIFPLILKNMFFCPAVFTILKNINRQIS